MATGSPARLVLRPPEELGEAAVRLEVAADHHGVVCLERLGHPVDKRARKPERVSDLAHGTPGAVRDEVADHPGVLGPVPLVDVLDHLLTAFRTEVDVDIRVGRPSLVDEPLEQQVVPDRIHARDPEGVRDDRIRRAPPPLGRDPPFLREPHQVPADEEELGESGPLDDIQLVGELADDRWCHRVVPPPNPCVAQLDQVRERRLASRHREPREPVALESQVDGA